MRFVKGRHRSELAPDGVEGLGVRVARRQLLRGVVDHAPVIGLAPSDQLDEALPVEAADAAARDDGTNHTR